MEIDEKCVDSIAMKSLHLAIKTQPKNSKKARVSPYLFCESVGDRRGNNREIAC